MAFMIQANKEGSEMQFCEFYEKNLLNKTTATFDKIKEAGAILGKSFDITCPQCAKNAWSELLSIYNSLKLTQIENKKVEEVIIENKDKGIEKEIEPLKEDIFTKMEYDEIKKTKSKK